MSRLTDNNKDNPILKDVGHANCKNICEHEVYCDMCPIQEAIDKLCHYENLEEQGRLIEQKHGQWIHKDNFIGKYLMCSECSHVTGRKSTYCPNCGAKMDEVENERKTD